MNQGCYYISEIFNHEIPTDEGFGPRIAWKQSFTTHGGSLIVSSTFSSQLNCEADIGIYSFYLIIDDKVVDDSSFFFPNYLQQTIPFTFFVNDITLGTHTFGLLIPQHIIVGHNDFLSCTMKEIIFPIHPIIMDHPLNPDHQLLIHGMLKGPDEGVYYRGSDFTDQSCECVIRLPEYTRLFTDFIVTVTPIFNHKNLILLNVSDVINNSFSVISSEPCKFNWFAIGKQQTIQTEVDKN